MYFFYMLVYILLTINTLDSIAFFGSSRILVHENFKMFSKCDICKKKFSTFSAMRRHREKCPKLQSGGSDTADTAENFDLAHVLQNAQRVCKFCHEIVDEGDFQNHLKTIHHIDNRNRAVEKLSFQCIICKKTFTRLANLKMHANQMHKFLRPIIKCPLCPHSRFQSEEELQAHTEQRHIAARQTRATGSFREISSALNRTVTVFAHAFQSNEVQSMEELEQRDDIWESARKILHREVYHCFKQVIVIR